MGTYHQDRQARQLPQGKSEMGTLLQDLHFGWVAIWQSAKVAIFSTLISKQSFFKDSLMMWTVMLCANCHQKQVIHQIYCCKIEVLWMISWEKVDTQWSNAFWPDLEKIFPSWFRRLERCHLYRTENSLNTRFQQNGPCIEVNQSNDIYELDEIPEERNTKEDLHCTPSMHTTYRSLLGLKNWPQS